MAVSGIALRSTTGRGPQPARSSAPVAAPADSWDLTTLALGGVMLTFVWRIQDLFPVIRPMRPAIVVPILALVLFAFSSDRRRKLKDVIRHPLVKTAGLIFALIILSIPGSLWPGLSFRFMLRDFLPNILCMLLVAASIRSFVDVERMAFAQLVGAALLSATLMTRFNLDRSGRLGYLGYYDANDFAMLIVCSIPLAIYFARRKSSRWYQIAAVGTLALLMVGLVKTGSRGGFLAMVAVAAYLLLAFRAVKAHVRVGVVATLALLLVVAANDTYWGFIKTLANPTEDYNWSGKSEGGRMEVWKRGIGYMVQNPLFGTGARTFQAAEGKLSPMAWQQEYGRGVKWTAAHNMFVEIGAEVGMIALGLFIWLLLNAVRSAWSAGRAPPPDVDDPRTGAAMGQVLAAGVIAYIVAGFFLSQAYAAWFYATLGIIVGFGKLSLRHQQAARPSGRAVPLRGVPAPALAAARPGQRGR